MDNVESVKASYDFPVKAIRRGDVGLMLGCCGAPPYGAATEKRLNDNFNTIKAQWERMEGDYSLCWPPATTCL
jgi:hypothetical protein